MFNSYVCPGRRRVCTVRSTILRLAQITLFCSHRCYSTGRNTLFLARGLECRITTPNPSDSCEQSCSRCLTPSLFQSTLLSALYRHFRRGSPSSPASSQSKTPGPKGSHEGQEPIIQLVQAFVRLVQR